MTNQDLLDSGKETIALKITPRRSAISGEIGIEIQPVYVRADKTCGTKDSIGYYNNMTHHKHKYGDVLYWAQTTSFRGVSYGQTEVFTLRCYGLSALEDILKTMRKIERGLDKIAQLEGGDIPLDERVVRLARVLGATAFYLPHNTSNFKLYRNIADLRGHVRTLVNETFDEIKKAS